MSDPFDTLLAGPVMAILRGFTPQRSVELAQRAWDLGIDTVEVPVQTPDALPSLRDVVDAGRERGLGVGAGTVVTVRQVHEVARAGAAFSVAPGFDPEVAAASHGLGMPHLPGVATPSEIQRAVRSGHRWLKVFPAGVLGPGWVRSMLGPFPELRLITTGGIDARNAPMFLGAGAHAVGVGSALEDVSQLASLGELIRRGERRPDASDG